MRRPIEKPAAPPRRFGDADLLATPSRGRPVRTILLATAAGFALGAIYLGIAPRQHAAAATLAVGTAAPTTQAAGVGGSEALRKAQADVIRSSEVLRLADAAAGLGALKTFARERDPVPTLRRNLDVDVAADGSVITVSYAAATSEEAAKIVNAVVEAYRRFVGQRRLDRAAEMVSAAEAMRAPVAKELAEARRRLSVEEINQRSRDNGEAARQRARSLAELSSQQQLLTTDARREYDAAVAEAGPQLARLSDAELDRAVGGPVDAGQPLRTPERIEAELAATAGRLAELKRTYAENHPSVAAVRQQLDRLRLERVVSTRQAWRALAAKADEAKRNADRALSDVIVAEAGEAERERLREDVSRLQARLATVDASLDSARAGNAYATFDVEVLAAAEPDDPTRPPTPRAGPTLWLAVLAGFTAGGMLAIAGEYRRAGTLRHVTTIRSDQTADATLAKAAFGLRVLGALPEASGTEAEAGVHAAIDGAIATAADAVPAALAADGWQGGSLAVVSAAGGSGGSLAAFALAAALARSGKATLLVEADARAITADGPGLGEALAEGSLAAGARETVVPGLKLLTFGAPRADFANLLNSPRFSDAIDAARGSFVAIVFDCPPLDTGDDGRVIGATTDAAVVVAEGNVASLRRAAGVRDVLRLAGATVLGVVLNRSGDAAAAPSVDQVVRNGVPVKG